MTGFLPREIVFFREQVEGELKAQQQSFDDIRSVDLTKSQMENISRSFEQARSVAYSKRLEFLQTSMNPNERQIFLKFLAETINARYQFGKPKLTIHWPFYDQGLFYVHKNNTYECISGLAMKTLLPYYSDALREPLRPLSAITVKFLLLLKVAESHRPRFGT